MVSINLPKKASLDDIVNRINSLKDKSIGIDSKPEIEEINSNVTDTVSLRLPQYYYSPASVIVYNDEIHIFGGGSGTSSSKLYTYHYKWDNKAWTLVDNMPVALYGASIQLYNNEIYILKDNSFYKYNGSTYTQLTGVTDTHGKFVIYKNNFYILGGRKYDNYEQGYWKYNISSNSWTLYNDRLPYPMRDAIPIVLNDVLYALGGDGTVNTRYDKYFYKTTGSLSSWTALTNLPFQPNIAVVYNNEIHIMGDVSATSKDSGSKYHYKWDGSSWTSVSTLPYAVCDDAFAVVHNGRIHLMGGYGNRYGHYTWDGSSWTNSITTTTTTIKTIFKYFLPKNTQILCDKTALLQDTETSESSSGVALTENTNGYIVSVTGNVRLLSINSPTGVQLAHSIVYE